MNTSEILKELRTEANLTQKELATKLKIGQSTIVGYEKGEREATVTNLSRYADFFGLSLDYLAGREDDFGARVPTRIVAPSVPESESLTDNEKALLKAFRRLLPETQDFILRTAQSLQDKKNVT